MERTGLKSSGKKLETFISGVDTRCILTSWRCKLIFMEGKVQLWLLNIDQNPQRIIYFLFLDTIKSFESGKAPDTRKAWKSPLTKAPIESLFWTSSMENLWRNVHFGLRILTFSRPNFAVFDFRPVASKTWSKSPISYVSPLFFFRWIVSFPSSPFVIFWGVVSECKFTPLPSYCSVTNLRHSSSKPLNGLGCT